MIFDPLLTLNIPITALKLQKVLSVFALAPQITFLLKKTKKTKKHFNQNSKTVFITKKEQKHAEVHHLIRSVLLLMCKGIAKQPSPTLDITSIKLSKTIHHSHTQTHRLTYTHAYTPPSPA